MANAMSPHSPASVMTAPLVQERPLVFGGPSAEDASEITPKFEDIYREHVAFVWRSLRRLGIREADAEDAVQDVFVIVHGKLATFEGRSRITTWLFGICFRVAQAKRRKAHVRYEAPEESTSDPIDPTALSPVDELLQGEALALLEDVLDALSIEQRAVFTLFELDGLSGQQIAELLDLPLGTIYSRLRLAREAFQRAAMRVHARIASETHGARHE